MRKFYNKAQSGRSMIEMLGVLAIIGVLSAGGIAGYSMAMSNYKTNELMDKVRTISTQARILYNGKYVGSTENIATALTNAGIVSDFKNPFGGTLTVMGIDADSFLIATSTAGVPTESCIKVLTSNWGDSSIFSGVGAGNAVIAAAPTTASYTVATAKTACTTTGTSRDNALAWTFK